MRMVWAGVLHGLVGPPGTWVLLTKRTFMEQVRYYLVSYRHSVIHVMYDFLIPYNIRLPLYDLKLMTIIREKSK